MNTPTDIALAEQLHKFKAKLPIRPQMARTVGEHLYGRHVVVAVVATSCGMTLQVLRSPADWLALSQATRPKPGATAKILDLYPSTVAETRHFANA